MFRELLQAGTAQQEKRRFQLQSFALCRRAFVFNFSESSGEKIMAYTWKFFRAGGFNQVVLNSGTDLLNLDQLDLKATIFITGWAEV